MSCVSFKSSSWLYASYDAKAGVIPFSEKQVFVSEQGKVVLHKKIMYFVYIYNLSEILLRASLFIQILFFLTSPHEPSTQRYHTARDVDLGK